MLKYEKRVCPQCGKIYSNKTVDKITLHDLRVSMTCPDGHMWIENFTLSYQGYEYNNKKYNMFGGHIDEN